MYTILIVSALVFCKAIKRTVQGHGLFLEWSLVWWFVIARQPSRAQWKILLRRTKKREREMSSKLTDTEFLTCSCIFQSRNDDINLGEEVARVFSSDDSRRAFFPWPPAGVTSRRRISFPAFFLGKIIINRKIKARWWSFCWYRNSRISIGYSRDPGRIRLWRTTIVMEESRRKDENVIWWKSIVQFVLGIIKNNRSCACDSRESQWRSIL